MKLLLSCAILLAPALLFALLGLFVWPYFGVPSALYSIALIWAVVKVPVPATPKKDAEQVAMKESIRVVLKRNGKVKEVRDA